MSTSGPLPPGCMPDFSRVHSVQSKRAAQFKSESARSLTEFREFKFTSGTSRRTAKFNAATAAKLAAAQAQQPAQQPAVNKSTKNKENAGPLAAAAPAAKKAKTVAEPSAPRLTLDSAAVCQTRQLLPASVSFTPSKLQQPRILPPHPQQQFVFAAPAPAPVARVPALASTVTASSFEPIPESPADADAEFGAASSFASSSSAAAAASSSSESAAVDDADFYSMDSCLHDILNDDAWKDADDDDEAEAAAAAEGSDTVALSFAAPAAAASTLPPCTPGRVGAGAARVLTTPRAGGAVDRGSIYGGAIRTPLRTKPQTPAIKTVPARLTISGVLPSANASRTATVHTAAAAAAGPLSSPMPAAGFGLSAAQRVKPVAAAAAGAPMTMATPVKPGAVIFRIAPSPAAPAFAAASVSSLSLSMLPPKTPARK